MLPRQLCSNFHRYERDRAAFAASCADAARAEGSTAALVELGAPRLLLPLLHDPSESVAHTAAAALGRLAAHSTSVAAKLAAGGVVTSMVACLRPQGSTAAAANDTESSASKRAAIAMLVSLARHTPELASAVAEQGGLAAAVDCMLDEDPEVREGAVWTLAHLVAHGEALAANVCSAGALPLLVTCLGSPGPADAPSKRVAASALGDICKHGAQLAAGAVQAGAVEAIAALLRQPLSNDARLKRQLLCALMHICKAEARLAEEVAHAGLLPDISRSLKFSDDTVRRHAASCLRDIARHSANLAAAVAAEPGLLDSLASYAAASTAEQAVSALLAFGFLGGHSEELAAQVAAAPGALPAVVAAVRPTAGDEHSRAAGAWALGRLGGHSPLLANQAAAGLQHLCDLAMTAPSGSDEHTKCLRAVAAIVVQLEDVALLASLLMQFSLAPQLVELLLARCTTVMTKQPSNRAAFVTAGALAHVQAALEWLPADSPTRQHIATCLGLFPQEIVNHYSPAYASKLLAQLHIESPPPADTIPAVPAVLPAPALAASPEQSAAQEISSSAPVDGPMAAPCEPAAEIAPTMVATAAPVEEQAVAPTTESQQVEAALLAADLAVQPVDVEAEAAPAEVAAEEDAAPAEAAAEGEAAPAEAAPAEAAAEGEAAPAEVAAEGETAPAEAAPAEAAAEEEAAPAEAAAGAAAETQAAAEPNPAEAGMQAVNETAQEVETGSRSGEVERLNSTPAGEAAADAAEAVN